MKPLRRTLSTIAPVLALLAWAATATAQESGPEATMLARINQLRAENGLGPLARDARLDAAARVHTEEMASRGELMHVSSTTGTPIDRAHTAGIAEASDIAENVAMHLTVEQAQAQLEASPPHLTNMLGPRASHVGLAAISTSAGIYVTQLFGRLETPAAAVAAVPPAAADGSVIAMDVPVAPAPPTEAPPAPPAASPPAAPTAPVATAGTAVVVPPDPSGVVRVPAPAPGVTGYWICAADARGGRWYYYPVRPGYSGTLSPDLSVTGSPPGYAPACSAIAPGARTYGSTPPPATAPGASRVLITPWGSVRVERR